MPSAPFELHAADLVVKAELIRTETPTLVHVAIRAGRAQTRLQIGAAEAEHVGQCLQDLVRWLGGGAGEDRLDHWWNLRDTDLFPAYFQLDLDHVRFLRAFVERRDDDLVEIEFAWRSKRLAGFRLLTTIVPMQRLSIQRLGAALVMLGGEAGVTPPITAELDQHGT